VAVFCWHCNETLGSIKGFITHLGYYYFYKKYPLLRDYLNVEQGCNSRVLEQNCHIGFIMYSN